jgi:DNA primase
VLLTEGVSDALAALSLGHPAVAALGAGRDPRQVAKVVRHWYPESAVLVAGDGDEAGRRFSAEMTAVLSRSRPLAMEEGKDLGEVVRMDPGEAAARIRDIARPLTKGRSLGLV